MKVLSDSSEGVTLERKENYSPENGHNLMIRPIIRFTKMEDIRALKIDIRRQAYQEELDEKGIYGLLIELSEDIKKYAEGM